MIKILCTAALSAASVYYAQNFAASEIPENLKKNADAGQIMCRITDSKRILGKFKPTADETCIFMNV
ncbi:hypothetical protein [Chryseobacterium salviniae]|uniref:hypothetical protein n=1 Tax=Chryseobacterium salviniae TaxID=3101750 RepID=UPI00398C350A